MGWPLSRARLARIAPFVIFIGFLALRGAWPAAWPFDARWLYGVSLVAVAAALLYFWRDYDELRSAQRPNWREAAWAVLAGALVFAVWIRLDAPWMTLAHPTAVFYPIDANGHLIWALVVVRWVGAAVFVPVLEELFWRSFVMRWIHDARFQHLPPQQVGPKAFVMSTALFVLAHVLWLAALIAGGVYAWLYRRTGKLWVAILAHAVTNGLLGVWVVANRQWVFW